MYFTLNIVVWGEIMIKVIRKQKPEPKTYTPSTISMDTIPSVVTEDSILFLESVKPAIELKYSSQGHPDKTSVELGVQYDHRVSWINFNLDELLWNLHDDYSEETKYYHYNFKLAVKSALGESFVWEFDGKTFEIPLAITQNPGQYTFTLIIEEYTEDTEEGNIKEIDPYFIERYITKPFTGTVVATSFDPKRDLTLLQFETDQLAALTKPRVSCSLADNGDFLFDNKIIGEKFDNFTTYFVFDPTHLTAHLDEFTLMISFKKDDQLYGALFEKTNPKDSLDIQDVRYPLIAWPPSEVYQTPGQWTVTVVGFAGNLEHMNNPSIYNSDYYFYVSKENTVEVLDNNLTKEDLEKEAIISTPIEMMTADNLAILTADRTFFIPSGGKND